MESLRKSLRRTLPLSCLRLCDHRASEAVEDLVTMALDTGRAAARCAKGFHRPVQGAKGAGPAGEGVAKSYLLSSLIFPFACTGLWLSLLWLGVGSVA